MKLLALFLSLISVLAADPTQPSIGGKQVIVATNGYSGILNVRTQLNVGFTNQTGLMTMYSTNGTYGLTTYVAPTGNHTVTDGDTNVLDIPLGTFGRYGANGTLLLTDGSGYQWNEKVVNVKSFGAHGNDTNDDTVAIQDAINFITATSPQREYSTLMFPAGIYKTTAPLLITNVIRIQGAGWTGPTVYEPLQMAGSMIRYYGTTGSAVEIGAPNFTFRVEMENIRVGAAEQAPKPDGIRIENLSEGTFSKVNVCCGFANGFVVRGCTLTKFDMIDSSANEVGMLIQNGVVSGDFPFVVGFISNPFHLCNFYLNSIAHIKIEGNIKNWAVRSSWFEASPIAIWVPPPTNFANALQLVEFDDTSFHGVDAVNAKVLKIDGGSVTNSLVVQSLSFRNSMFYMGSSNAVSITMTNNLGQVNDFSDLTFENIEGYTLTNSVGSSNTLVYADTLPVGLSLHFKGAISVLDGFAQGNSGSIYTGPGAPNYDLTGGLLYRDFASRIGKGKLWRLPSSDPLEYTESLFGYASSPHFRPFWFIGTNAADLRLVAEVDNNHVLLDNVNPITILPLTVDTNEFGYLDGVTSSIQTQIDGKSLQVKETDASPSVNNVTIIQVSPGTLTDNGGGNVTINTSGSPTGTYSELFNKTGGLYTNTLTYALIDFATGNDMQISLPSAGTYKVEAELDYFSGGSTFPQYYKFRNTTDSSDVANSERILSFSTVSDNKDHLFYMCNIITVAASKTIAVYTKVDDVVYDHCVNSTNCAIGTSKFQTK